MPKKLEAVEARLKRAVAQLVTIDKAVAGWTERNTKVSSQMASFLGADRTRLAFAIGEIEPETVIEIGHNAGEFVHNLRSLLDNLMYALALLRRDPPTDPRSIHFPICEDERAFQAAAVQRAVRQVPDRVSDAISLIQPFQRLHNGSVSHPGDDPLLLLQRLNNLDKHRLPLEVTILPSTIQFTGSFTFMNEHEAGPPSHLEILPIENGRPFLVATMPGALEAAEAKMEVAAGLAIVNEDGRLDFQPTLLNLLRYTHLVVDHFKPFFLSTAND